MNRTGTAFKVVQMSSMLSRINNLLISTAMGNDDCSTNKRQNIIAPIYIFRCTRTHKSILIHRDIFCKIYYIVIYYLSNVSTLLNNIIRSKLLVLSIVYFNVYKCSTRPLYNRDLTAKLINIFRMNILH